MAPVILRRLSAVHALTYACAAVGLYCVLWHHPYSTIGSSIARRLRRTSDFFGVGSADLLILPAGDTCAGRRLFATVPHHGLGNKLNWIGTAAIAAASYSRCLRLITTDAERFEDWGFAPMTEPSSKIEFVPAVPAGIPRLHILENDAVHTRPADVFGGDGYDCRRVSTNCHALSEGVIRDAFFAQTGDLDLGKSWFALRPQQLPLPTFDKAFTRFLSSIALLPHLASIAEAIMASCRAMSTSGFVIGAHYRGGDSCDAAYVNASLRRCSPLVHIITEVTRAASAHPGAVIFLASDSAEAMANIQGALPNLQFCTSGRAEAAVDLQLLARTHLIVGSRYSSFSHIAARWAGVSLVEAG